MPAVQRAGDANGAGGAAQGGVASVRVNGQPIIVDGNSVTAHAPYGRPHPPHAAATTTGGNGTVKAGGIPVITTGCTDTCGHARAGGSGDVRAG
jgi:uncharacterized Zn-binding protein involved in type VI secretion